MKIVVIGGTGLIGSKLVKTLRERGHEALAASPNTGVNTITRKGLAEALDGADVVVDVAARDAFDPSPSPLEQADSSRATAANAARIFQCLMSHL